MADQTLLSELCRICNNNAPKYCCPRCNSRTCSLLCYKRHQSWAQCSGKRDPAAYIARSQLATPAGIDRDFNFLTGIERSFDAADANVGQRGIALHPHDRRDGPVPGSNLLKNLDASGALIHRAPVGMSRQTVNRTYWHGKYKCVSWTVEWVHPDATREHGQCRENLPLADAYERLLEEKRPKKRKRATPERDGQAAEAGSSQSLANVVVNPEAIGDRASVTNSGSTVIGGSDAALSTRPELLRTTSDRKHPSGLSTDNPFPMTSITSSSDSPNNGPSTITNPSATAPRSSFTAPSTSLFSRPLNSLHAPQLHYFYLHKPLSPSTSRVLIPLPRDATLSTCLRNRLILEYPTIYVLQEPPSALPAGFQLETEHLQQTAGIFQEHEEHKEHKAVGGRLFDLGVREMGTDPAADTVEEAGRIEETRVLESLRRDVEAVSRGF